MKKLFIRTYGCTLNQSDSELMEALLVDKGNQLAPEDDADIIIVNTCAVKETTENKILHYLKKLDGAGKKIIVAGCLPVQNFPGVKRAAPHAMGYIGPNSFQKIPEIISGSTASGSKFLGGDFSSKFGILPSHKSLVAKIQVSSGCMSNCAFCATKIARGKFRSKPLALIMEEAKLAIRNGAKELQLASQDNGCYGFDLKTSMPELLNELNALDGRFRIRAGMANPQHLLKNLDEWVEAFSLPKVYKFLHLPLQSGSSRILREMRRGYSVEEAEVVALEFRNKIPDLTLATDMIVGFPTETEGEFEESLEICWKLAFDVVNFSKYSRRKNTAAWGMRQLKSQVIKERAELMNKVAKEIALHQNRRYLGRGFDVLITEKAKGGYMQGRSINYKAVLIPEKRNGGRVEIGQFAAAEIKSASVTSLIAE
ncbi:MAG: tRNA (N(6)-L-threonylcarbamoyladenosine(37)-C(2))-methylthiotransferase [Candidatus Micrarchaeota archaeon]